MPQNDPPQTYGSKPALTNGPAIALSNLLAISEAGQNVRVPANLLLNLVTAQSLGLEKVDNTPDDQKPLSQPQAQALSAVSQNVTAVSQSLASLLQTTQFTVLENDLPRTVSAWQLIQELVDFHNDDLATILQNIRLDTLNPILEEKIAISGLASDMTTGIGASYMNYQDITIVDMHLDLETPSSDTDITVMMTVDGINALQNPILIQGGHTGTSPTWVFNNEMPNKNIGNGKRIRFNVVSAGTGVRGAVINLRYKTRISPATVNVGTIPTPLV